MSVTNLNAKGMSTDNLEKFQKEGTYRFAMNAVLETTQGDMQGISNEMSNAYCATGYPPNKKVIGHVLTDTDDIVLFLYDPDPVRPLHEIGIYSPANCKYTTVAKGACLNFSDKHQVNAIFRIHNGCYRYIYFTDNYNPYRVANITDTTDWVFPSTKNIINCDRILYTRPYTIPQVAGYNGETYNYGISNSGGELEYGSYSFAIRLLDYEHNPTDWLAQTRYFPIGAGNEDAAYNVNGFNYYTGAVNQEGEIGYKERSNKSIKLDLTYLSTDFHYYQIAVIKRTASSGGIAGVDILNEVPYTGDKDQFIYTGNPSQVVGQSSIDEILSEKVRLDKVTAHTHVEDRLFVANTENAIKDYIGFQRHASSIKTSWTHANIVQGVPIASDPKSAVHYQSFSGLMHDEVYAFGIVYVFDDGTESPVFHIPGRPKDIFTNGSAANNAYIIDTNPLDSFILPISNVNVFDDAILERWKVYNTYTKNSPSATKGLMGYYETSTKYPVVNTPCDNHPDGYWGRDFAGNLIVPNNSKIRHHRTPLLTARDGTNTDAHHRCGVEFFMDKDYPSEKITGHYYVISDRKGNETVIDTGILNHVLDATSSSKTFLPKFFFNGVTPISGTDRDAFFLSAKTVYKEQYPQGEYVRILKVLNDVNNSALNTDPPGGAITRFGLNVHNGESSIMYHKSYDNPLEFNYTINFSTPAPKNVNYGNGDVSSFKGSQGINTGIGDTFHNPSTSINGLLVTLDRKITDLPDAPYYVAIKSEREVYSNLSNIRYIKTHSPLLYKQESVNLTTPIYAGDIFVTATEVTDIDFTQTSSTDLSGKFISYTYYADQDINTAFRLSSEGENGKYTTFKHSYSLSGTFGDHLLSYMANKLYKDNDIVFWNVENHNYSEAYSYLAPDSVYLPLESDHDFCSDCKDDKAPYRIYYSELDNLESNRDYYRTIRPNNYKDLSSSNGEITDLFIVKDNMYALTTNSLYFIPYQAQRLTSDANSIYIGTGEVFSTNPREFKSTDYAFGGSRHFKCRTITEYGAVYVDDKSGRVINLMDGIKDITMEDMRNFWQENGKLFLNDQYKSLTGKEYPIISTSADYGIGYITAYDPRFKRLIICKRDFGFTDLGYRIMYKDTNTSPSGNNVLWFNGETFQYRNDSGVVSTVRMDDTKFFENRSFTISYSFISGMWVSFHSYMPYYLFNDYRTFYTNGVYKHNIQNTFQTYYGKKYDFIVDFVAALDPSKISTYSYSDIRAKATKYDQQSQSMQYTSDTFDRVIAYNSKQSSGLMDLVKTGPFDVSAPDTCPIKFVDNMYRISKLRDNTVSNQDPIWNYNKAAIATIPYSFIDRLPNLSNINASQSAFTLQRLKDYYLGMRLFFKPQENIKITLDLVDTLTSSRNR